MRACWTVERAALEEGSVSLRSDKNSTDESVKSRQQRAGDARAEAQRSSDRRRAPAPGRTRSCNARSSSRPCRGWRRFPSPAFRGLERLRGGGAGAAPARGGRSCSGRRWAPGLHIAAGGGHAAVVEALLRHGADVAAADADGRQALHYAARLGNRAAVEALLQQGGDIAAVDARGGQALHFAAKSGHAAVVEACCGRGRTLLQPVQMRTRPCTSRQREATWRRWRRWSGTARPLVR